MRRLKHSVGRLFRPKVNFQLPVPEHPMENFFNEAAVADEAAVAGSYLSPRSQDSEWSVETASTMDAHSRAPSALSSVNGDSDISEDSDPEGRGPRRISDPTTNKKGPNNNPRTPSDDPYAAMNSQILGPTWEASRRHWRRKKDTKPTDAIAERLADVTTAVAVEEDEEELDRIGNIAWYFGNWGQLSKKSPATSEGRVALDVKHRIKQNPAQVIGLAECEAETEQVLADPAPAAVAAENLRAGFEYLTLRGQEAATLLMGARANTSQRVELLEWHRLKHGKFQRRICYSRTMLCKIYTDDSVGLLGRSHTCRLIHLHRHLANGIWPAKLKAFWDWLAGKADNMDVLMGDFNMSLFLVVPELRKRGVTIDLAAWFPWKQPDCTPMVARVLSSSSTDQAFTSSRRDDTVCMPTTRTASIGMRPSTKPQSRRGGPVGLATFKSWGRRAPASLLQTSCQKMIWYTHVSRRH